MKRVLRVHREIQTFTILQFYLRYIEKRDKRGMVELQVREAGHRERNFR